MPINWDKATATMKNLEMSLGVISRVRSLYENYPIKPTRDNQHSVLLRFGDPLLVFGPVEEVAEIRFGDMSTYRAVPVLDNVALSFNVLLMSDDEAAVYHAISSGFRYPAMSSAPQDVIMNAAVKVPGSSFTVDLQLNRLEYTFLNAYVNMRFLAIDNRYSGFKRPEWNTIVYFANRLNRIFRHQPQLSDESPQVSVSSRIGIELAADQPDDDALACTVVIKPGDDSIDGYWLRVDSDAGILRADIDHQDTFTVSEVPEGGIVVRVNVVCPRLEKWEYAEFRLRAQGDLFEIVPLPSPAVRE